jgi:hypothetical protein
MKAMIIYDDFALAAKADAVLTSAAYRSGEAAQWNVKPWGVDMLHLSPAAAEALTDGADAHLIVFALRQRESLSVWLFDWLEQWAAHRQVQEAALAVWDGEHSGGGTMAAVELSQFAQRHGLTFIFDEDRSVEAESAVFASGRHEREVALTPVMVNILEQPEHSGYRHWGINE